MVNTTYIRNQKAQHEPSSVVDAVVVGAGFAGLYALHKLTEQGLNVRAYETGSGVGGTWFWNQYPGAHSDVESLEYSYSFSEQLQQEWTWSQRYAPQSEILNYINHVADRFSLRRHISFNTRVLSAKFNEEHNLWMLKTSTGESVQARYCVMASGNLSTYRVPEFPGIDKFEGEWFHSSRWPTAGVDMSGKRVGVIGTGSTGIQIIPVVAKNAGKLYVFQRSPNFCVPAQNAPLDAQTHNNYKAVYQQKRQMARESVFGLAGFANPTQSALSVSPEERTQAYERMWAHGSNQSFLTCFNDLLTSQESNDTAAEFVRGKIRQIVKNAKTAEVLCPKDHPIGARRLCVGTDYFETFNQPHVTLVDVCKEPITEITAKGIKAGTKEIELDTIVFATGFDAMTGALKEIDIRGRNQLALRDKWNQGPTTYLGLMVADFPNLFIITGPGSPSVKSNMVFSIEQHVDWIADCMKYLEQSNIASIEPAQESETNWVAHVNEVASRTLYPMAHSWYMGANVPGKARVFMPYVGGIPTYRKICDEVAAEGYRGFVLKPGFSHA
jgi:cyclohexanone monooxygenase